MTVQWGWVVAGLVAGAFYSWFLHRALRKAVAEAAGKPIATWVVGLLMRQMLLVAIAAGIWFLDRSALPPFGLGLLVGWTGGRLVQRTPQTIEG